MKVFVVFAAVAAFVALVADAAPIYKWTDAKGQVHYGEQPPEDKKASATLIDAGSAPTEADRLAAADRLANAKASLRNSAAAAAAPALPAASSATPSRLPASASSAQGCEEQWKAYNESNACMAPYRYIGGTRPEGVERCGNVPQPIRCPLSFGQR